LYHSINRVRVPIRLNCNHGRIFIVSEIGPKARYWYRIAIFSYHCRQIKPIPGKTAANIFEFFFSKPSQMPGVSRGVKRFCKTSTVYLQLEQTDRRKSDLNSKRLLYITFAKILSGVPDMSRDFPSLLKLSKASFGWLHGTVVERQSLTSKLSLSCARPAADG